MTIPARLLNKCIITPTGCWLWQGSKTNAGYGKAWYNGKVIAVHRLFYLLCNGPISAGYCVIHICDEALCVNPEHLVTGTPKDNAFDSKMKGRRARQDGEHNGAAKLSQRQVNNIRTLYATGALSQRRLATAFGVSQGAVWAVVNHVNWGVAQ